jgi:hypothetical protein
MHEGQFQIYRLETSFHSRVATTEQFQIQRLVTRIPTRIATTDQFQIQRSVTRIHTIATIEAAVHLQVQQATVLRMR